MLCFARSADLDGGNRQVVVTGAGHPYGIAIYEEYVYWSSYWESKGLRIERANRFTGLNHQEIYNATGWTDTFRVNHPSKQPTG